MLAPLAFYPAPGVARFHYWVVAAAACGAALLLASLVTRPDSGQGWLADAATLAAALLLALAGWLAHRRARRIAQARANNEPQLVVDHFGILIRGDFLWRPHRFAWSRIASIEAIPHERGLSIVVAGDLRPLGRLVDLTVDSTEPAELVAERLQQFARLRPTVH